MGLRSRLSGRPRSVLAAGAGVLATAALVIGLAATPAYAEGVIVGAGAADAVPGSYLVVLKEPAVTGSVQSHAGDLAARYGGEVGFVYDAAITGFSITMSDRAARRLAAHPSVAYVEHDMWTSSTGTQLNPPSWGLDRIDQVFLPLNNSYTYRNTAPNVRIYVLDTGIRRSHNDFGGRALIGFDAVTPGGTANDCHGHGTHVAGTAAGALHGVAKAALVYSVRVLPCSGSGTVSQAVAGINWVTNNAIKPAVANLSMGSAANSTYDNAVSNSIASGVTYVVSAGNDNFSACNKSPARVAAAITVAATTQTDARRSTSNFGSCVDIFAPGSEILSAWHTSDSATAFNHGTSMAAPHVSGAAAMLLSINPSWSPGQVKQQLVHSATPWLITNAGLGSPNRLLFVGPTAPHIVFFDCFSMFSNFTCNLSYTSADPVTITWTRDFVPVPAWQNLTQVSGTCQPGTNIQAQPSNMHGSISIGWNNCNTSGFPVDGSGAS